MGGCKAEFLSFERHGGGTGPSDFDFSVGSHDFDEFVEFFGIAGGFDGVTLGGAIDDAGLEDLGLLNNGGARGLLAADTDEDHFADYGGYVGEVGGLENVDELVDLLDDLGAEAVFDVDDDGHAGKLRVDRFGDRKAFDVVAAGRRELR